MSDINVEWDDSALQEALQKLINECPERVQQAMTNACLKVEQVAKEKCPRETGELRRSIQSEVKNENGTVTGIVGTNLDYAPYVDMWCLNRVISVKT